jgi:uncharacterized membrane protein
LADLRTWVELIASFVEALAVTMMVGFIVFGTLRWLFSSNDKLAAAYGTYRADLGKGLLVGLELLVAADIIRTVALDLTLINILTLAALVVRQDLPGLDPEPRHRGPLALAESARGGSVDRRTGSGRFAGAAL